MAIGRLALFRFPNRSHGDRDRVFINLAGLIFLLCGDHAFLSVV